MTSIGIFDSGLGGYSIYHVLQKEFPNARFTLLVDQKNAPFGSKTKEELLEIMDKACQFFIQKHIKTVIVACNTMCANTLKEMQEKYPELTLVSIIELTVNQLKEDTKSVLVLATQATVNTGLYPTLISLQAKNAWIDQVAAIHFVDLVEGLADENDIDEEVEKVMKDYNKVEVVVLACTHYPMIKDNIQKTTKAELVDSINPVIEFVRELELPSGDSQIYTTLSGTRLEHQVNTLFQTKVKVKEVEL